MGMNGKEVLDCHYAASVCVILEYAGVEASMWWQQAVGACGWWSAGCPVSATKMRRLWSAKRPPLPPAGGREEKKKKFYGNSSVVLLGHRQHSWGLALVVLRIVIGHAELFLTWEFKNQCLWFLLSLIAGHNSRRRRNDEIPKEGNLCSLDVPVISGIAWDSLICLIRTNWRATQQQQSRVHNHACSTYLLAPDSELVWECKAFIGGS